jgi:hypothetical protein
MSNFDITEKDIRDQINVDRNIHSFFKDVSFSTIFISIKIYEAHSFVDRLRNYFLLCSVPKIDIFI